jgi:hypothetical protein
MAVHDMIPGPLLPIASDNDWRRLPGALWPDYSAKPHLREMKPLGGDPERVAQLMVRQFGASPSASARN